MSVTAPSRASALPAEALIHLPADGRSLFFEDFDAQSAPPAPAPEPAEAAPMFSEAELVSACDACRNEGWRQGLEQGRAEHSEAQGRAIAAIAAALAEAAPAAREAAEDSAAEVARLLLSALGALLPDLCTRFGAAEAAAVAQALLPALRHEPATCVRVHPDTCAELAPLLEAMDPDRRAILRLVATEAMAPGDVRIEWQNGAAVREGAALWRAAAAVLSPLDLLAGVPAAPVAVQAAVPAAPNLQSATPHAAMAE
jgi:hypothetical protein